MGLVELVNTALHLGALLDCMNNRTDNAGGFG